MYDALEELSDLSLALQRADINLPMANKLVSRQVEVFVTRKTADAEYYKEACAAVESGVFRGVQVSQAANKQPEIPKAQFYQALANSIAARLLPDSEKELCNAVKVVDHTYFPQEMSPEFGEVEVRSLCSRFGLDFSAIKHDYREYKDSKGNVVTQIIKQLKNCINTLPVSTAECVSGFSKNESRL